MVRPDQANLADYLRVLPQYLVPQHALSRAVDRLARCRWVPVKNGLIKLFIRWFNVDMALAREPRAENYHHFNHFFTRELKPGVRPVAREPGVIACPIDGYISQIGTVESGEIFQAKNRYYDIAALLAGEKETIAHFREGSFATFYLSPRDYHRIHMPCDGRLEKMIHVPGKLFAVNDHTARVVPALYARNERLICLFDTDIGPMAIILVGALFVGSLETVWAGRIMPNGNRKITNRTYPEHDGKIQLRRGEEMGRFNMGSTVILLFGKGAVAWSPALQQGTPVTMGKVIAISPGK